MGVSREAISSSASFIRDAKIYTYTNSPAGVRYQVNDLDGARRKDIDRQEFLDKARISDDNTLLPDEELNVLYPPAAKAAVTKVSVSSRKPSDTIKVTTDGVCAVVEDFSGNSLGNYCGEKDAPTIKDGTLPINTEKLKPSKSPVLMGAGTADAANDVKKIQALKDSLPPHKLDEIAQAAKAGASLIIKEVGSPKDHPIQQHFGYTKPVDKINPQLRH